MDLKRFQCESIQINLYGVPCGAAAKLTQKQTKSRPKQTKKKKLFADGGCDATTI
jgi:hypothetical protein